MPRLTKAEIESHHSEELAKEIEGFYRGELAKIVCRGCGRYLRDGESRSEECKGCGVAGRFENLHHNEAVQGTRTLVHAALRDRHPALRRDGEAAWSIVDGSTSDAGHVHEIGVVHHAGFKHDHELEQKLRDEARAKAGG